MAISNSFFNRVSGIKKSTTEQKKSVSKFSTENIVYSDTLVYDLKLLRKCTSLESIDNYINNRLSELSFLEDIEEQAQNRWKAVSKRALEIQNTVSLEAAELYFFSLEAMPDVKNALARVGDSAKKIFEKLFSLVAGFGKRISSWVNSFFLGQANKFYEKFPVADFKNLDVEVNAVKLPNDIVAKLEKSSSDDTLKALRNQLSTMDFGGARQMKETADKVNPNNIYQLIFGEAGAKGMPKKEKMKISEFFNGAKPGERPALIEILSPKMKKLWQEDIEAIKQLGVAIRKSISNSQNKIGASSQDPDAIKKYNESIAGLRFALARMQARKFNDFNAKAQIAGMVYNIAKRACSGKGSGEEKKEGNE